MQSEWPIVPVADCCDLIVDCVNKTAPITEGATPFRMIRTTNVRNGFIDLADCKFVDEDTFRIWTRRANVLDGDVILTREAPIGEVGLVRGNQNIFLGQRLMQYRANRSLLDPRFLCYAFLSPQLQHQFGAHEGSGSVVSHIRVGDCSKFKVPLPPLPVQREIAELLGSIDERVLLLRQTNLTLESIAQALFKSWFIDFDPVRAKAEGREPEGMDAATAALFPDAFSDSALGAIPRGWIQAQLSQAIAIRDGKPWASDNRVDISKVKVFGANGPVGFALEALETGRVVFLGKIGSCGALNSFNGEWWATNNVFYISQTLNRELEWCRHVLMTIDFKGYIGGSSNPYMPLKNFGHHPILVPPVELRSKFESMAALYRAKIEANQKQADSLAQVRDALLPRLISGKLRLPEAQERVEDALA